MMDFGDLDDIIQSSVPRSNRHQAPYSPKQCYPQWFLDDSLSADEDDIKFRADYFYGQRQYKQALDTYISLLNEKRFGKNRSLMTEVYESISLCYRKLGEYENANLFCCKSDELCKSADHKLTNLFIRSRILLETGSSKDTTEVNLTMKKLLILHPYNHFLWFDFANLQTDPSLQLLYLIRTRLLLEMNYKSIQEFIKARHEELTQQVASLINQHRTVLSEKNFVTLEKLVNTRDSEERIQEEWQTEDYKLKILEDLSSEEVNEVFRSKWMSLLSQIT